ncbi:sulfatase-like hydrolase/transferase [Puniceicoccus vermicola]|uniref:Sulfatase-like hydrolase/transferase n=1 Tax=Puniceicoccus vermicola TaxID=388746 RepID=A0A7X1B0C7_9BACT|nr:sulfatase-like hydrolase/transferase [Puniceicoccus vermicola]MBC2603227.1 sulfatase-like hydrolase/transferase [Puniceicoccus vermicola]
MKKPNIVLIMTDQQRWDTLACLGFDHMQTPNLDRLAGSGSAFRHAYVQGAVCGPSRNCIVSGRYVHVHGAERNEEWLDAGQPNWIESLQSGGYRTVNIGKMHTAPIRLPCGFDERTVVENKNYQVGLHGPDPDDYDLELERHGLKRPALTYYRDIPDWPDRLQATTWPHAEELYPDHFIGRRCVEAIDRWEPDQPQFLWAGFVGPHDPYDVPESALARYEDVKLPPPVKSPGELESKPPPQKRFMERLERTEQPAMWCQSRATPERLDRMRRHYFANISLIDDWVGNIVKAVESKGLLDNTVFVFTSDHGDCLGDHHQIYKFSSHYDPVVRVPFIVSGPGLARNQTVDSLIELIDLGPTLLDLAGLAPLEGANGISLRSGLEGGNFPARDAVFSETGPRVMIRTLEWKLVTYIGEPYGELYDLVQDPDELRNRFDDPKAASVRAELTERLFHWFARTRMRRPA